MMHRSRRRPLSRAFPLTLLLVILGVPSAARARGQEAGAFAWEAPAECPGRQEVLERLAEVHGPGLDTQSALGAARVRGQIDGQPGHWVLRLNVDAGAGEKVRLLESEQCGALAHAAALALALLLEEATASAASQSPEPAAQGAPPLRQTDEQKDEAREEPEPSPAAAPLAVSAGVSGVLDSATLGNLAAGVNLALLAWLRAWNLAVYASWLPARRMSVAGTQAVEFEHWDIGLRPCHHLLGTSWSLEACASGEIGRVYARGTTLDRPRDVANSWMAAGIGLGLRWRRSGGALQARTDVLLPLSRERYIVNASELVHETPSAVLRLTLGLDLDL